MGIKGAAHQHLVRSRDELRLAQERIVHDLQRRGADVRIRNEDETLEAFINHGRWVAECSCGAGVALEPGWPEACCFGCGRRYTKIDYPRQRQAIEAELEKRPRERNRNWTKAESVADLKRENQGRGI